MKPISLIVHFHSAMAPATFRVKLDDLNLKPGTPVKNLTSTGGRTCSCDAPDKLVEAKRFNFAPLDIKIAELKK